METKTPQDELDDKIRARFKELPKVVQDAITSADVQKQMRELANTNKLHVDQWQLLENEVLLTLLGFQETDKLAENLAADLDIPSEMSVSLAAAISKIVFEPIRGELERALEHPDAKAAEVSGVETARTQVLAETMTSTPIPSVAPATPPSAPQTQRTLRAPISAAYKAGEPSSIRPSIEDDPYRESPA